MNEEQKQRDGREAINLDRESDLTVIRGGFIRISQGFVRAPRIRLTDAHGYPISPRLKPCGRPWKAASLVASALVVEIG